MAIMTILKWPDPRLSVASAPLGRTSPVVAELADAMLETMYAAPGRGLAAPQVGVMARMFVMDMGWKDGPADPWVMIDPVVEWVSDGTAAGPEACLSLPGIEAEVTRPTELDVRWIGLDGETHRARLEGFEAICAQHEIDHLNGILTLDRVSQAARLDLVSAYFVPGTE
ncbi:peptide deformylase [Tranquillimonas rosea]|uniref:peptide deformylase n=1 Tax=Tranquillimonas rosea TaxID=641238 RepID=UPI003BAD6B84